MFYSFIREYKSLLVKDFAKRCHNEVALVHERMGNLQVGFVDADVVVEQDVNVDDAVVIVDS